MAGPWLRKRCVDRMLLSWGGTQDSSCHCAINSIPGFEMFLIYADETYLMSGLNCCHNWTYTMIVHYGHFVDSFKNNFLTHTCTHVHACTRTHICTQTHTYTHTHKRMNWDLLVGKAPCGHSTMLLGKSHSHSTLLFGSLPSIALETVSMFMMILSHLFKKYCQQERLSRANSLYTFLPRVVNNVMSLVLCPLVVSQAPQHFRSSEVPASCNGSFARQSVSGYFPWLCHVQDSLYIHRSLCRWTSNTDKTASLGFSFHFWLFVANSLNLWGAIWVVPDWWFSADPSLFFKTKRKRKKKKKRCLTEGLVARPPKVSVDLVIKNNNLLLLLFGCWFPCLVNQQPKGANSEFLLKPAFWSSGIQNFCVAGFQMALKEKSKVFKYAKWPSKWLTNESLVWDLIK